MEIRCKAGDTAIILFDEPECLGNVGRLVKVHPTLQINHHLELECWLIEPLDDLPWFISENDGTIRLEVVSLNTGIEHPDAWMMPIRDYGYSEEEMAAYARIQEIIDQNMIEIGAVRNSRISMRATNSDGELLEELDALTLEIVEACMNSRRPMKEVLTDELLNDIIAGLRQVSSSYSPEGS